MRLWSVHPRYLDRRGLVALWREGLLAQAVLRGETRGYRFHPQLQRFLACDSPLRALSAYLRVVHDEATRRGYRFDRTKLARPSGIVRRIAVTRGQLEFEWHHLQEKLARRDPQWLEGLPRATPARTHPSFRLIDGGIEPWERGHQ